ncbi:MAG: site-2 protease family protein [Chlamydiota bacterium]
MFRKRFHLLTFAGIPIGIDISWFLIAIFLTWTLAAGHFPYLYPGLPLGSYWLMGLGGMLGLFICIILHELGHALVAKRYKLPVLQITLFIFGGIAELKKEPKSPLVEFLVAIAGPIVSVLLAMFFYTVSQFGELNKWPITITGVTYYLALINALIVAFNLVPAFPLDGGRILRSILWGWKKNLAWATKITTQMGAGFGFFLLFFGIFSLISGNFITGVWFIILGLFLQRTAIASQTRFYVGKELKEEKVSKFMKTNLDSVSPDITIKDLIDHHVYQSHHHLYPITQNDRLIGYITLQEIKTVPAEDWDRTLVKNLMQPLSKGQLVSPHTNALDALEQVNQAPFPTLFVLEDDRFIGLLTAQDLLKLISLKLALEGAPKY